MIFKNPWDVYWLTKVRAETVAFSSAKDIPGQSTIRNLTWEETILNEYRRHLATSAIKIARSKPRW